jgi:hypothetical protein
MDEPSPILVAESINELTVIADLLKAAWSNFQNESFLPSNNATKQIRLNTLKQIEQVSPNCDLSFWD